MNTIRYLILVFALCVFGILLVGADDQGGAEPAPTAHTVSINQTTDDNASWWNGTIKLSDRSQTRLIITGILLIVILQAVILGYLIAHKKRRTFILIRK
ncbi:MAG: hypothetical protein PHW62_00475 [Candidatus Ratteibacteria bacterium]|nr:hypothetical protein [Candidatus Ratteibacteria bacterium]